MRNLAHKASDEREQTIFEHAQAVEKLAGEITKRWGFEEYGQCLGRYHDCGKYAYGFQTRICDGSRQAYDHSIAGAYLLLRRWEEKEDPIDFLLAHLVAGHHSGLPDTGNEYDSSNSGTLLSRFLKKKDTPMDFSEFEDELGALPVLPKLPSERSEDAFQMQFLGRMLFSALVDADFLDTERFMSNGSVERDPGASIEQLKKQFDRYMEEMTSSGSGALNQKRNEILHRCREMGKMQDKGMFRLTVPTGGGKTLSSMAFALEHALQKGHKRIIYIIPYVSIIRQTVEIFERIFGSENVLGHYSTAEWKTDAPFKTKNGDQEHSPEELASENWDRPIIVATNVQFFESLFSNKTSRCRKLHNIAESVLIFDEAQMLPMRYLRPCMSAVGELVRGFGCTAVLCTATQPALEFVLPKDVVMRSEICPDVERYYKEFRRVKYVWDGEISVDALCERILECPSALCICNRKKTVRVLYERLKEQVDGVFHLSTYMTQSDIGKCLQEIRCRLQEKKACYVLSTSLVEAGVDLDFPAVFRELTGLDSIIQAGGRCNRENRATAEESTVHIFKTEHQVLHERERFSELIIDKYERIDTPEAIHEYFSQLYQTRPGEVGDKLDEKGIVEMLSDNTYIPYREVSEAFQLIEETQYSILIPTQENSEAIAVLRSGSVSREVLRRTAKDLVSVNAGEMRFLIECGSVAIYSGVAVLEDLSRYRSDIGIRCDEKQEFLSV